ncbi:hypothetical protein GGR57DRAFT_102205 [Xylariaceae sp. FL1272]|nr:hypothetical protein GGR57DRAFT_102205 [Xylariaceae sp. FL1272]
MDLGTQSYSKRDAMADNKDYQPIPRSSADEEDVPLFDSRGSIPIDRSNLSSRRGRVLLRLSKAIRPLFWHGLVMITYLIAISVGVKKYYIEGRQCHKPLVYSPAQGAVKYEKVDYDGGLYQSNVYKGPPSPESDAAWTELVAPTNIRLNKHTLKMINRTALELSDHSGYHGGMGVHHHLHCLKYIRQALHPEYYTGALAVDPDLMEHVYHCIDDVRQALMCNPDISIYTHVWIPGYRKPWPNFDVEHECINWEVLNGWAIENSFDMFEPNLLIHPELGKPSQHHLQLL